MTKKVMGFAIAALLCAGLLFPLNADRDTLEFENFDGDWDQDNPPSGWDIIYLGGGGSGANWNKSSNRAHMGWEWRWGTTDRLISPVVDCSDPQYEEVWLYLFHNFNWYGYPNDLVNQIRGSTDGGDEFDIIIFDYNNQNHGPQYEYFDITDWALGEENVAIDFYCYGNTYSMNYWDVDNFLIYGYWEGSGGEGELDLEMSAINRPFDEEEGGVAFTPSCKIYNNTDADVEAKVTCKIRDMDEFEYVYEDAISNFVCNPDYTDCDAFDDFTPDGDKLYRVEFVVENPDDINPDNDHLDKRFTTILGTQIDATEIVAPVSEEHLQFVPSCKFMEMLSKESPDIWLHCMIESSAFHQVYHDSTQYSFAADEEYTADFTETDLADGNYSVTFWAVGPRGGDLADALGEIQTTDFTFLGIDEEPGLEFALDVTGNTVSYTLGNATEVSLKVYDAAGNVVETLVSGSRAAGTYSVTWDADVSGVYFVRLVTSEFVSADKLTILN